MKKIITAILIFSCVSAFAQDSTYNDKVKFNMTDSVENGIAFQRKAVYEAMIYNQRVKTISLQFTVEFYNTAGTQRMKLVKPYTKEVTITNDEYVITATGVIAGTIKQALSLYGTALDTLGNYLKLPDGRYVMSTPVMTHYDYVVKSFDNNNKLHTIIKNAGTKAAGEGKLN